MREEVNGLFDLLIDDAPSDLNTPGAPASAVKSPEN
jgi:hypothetical protein